MPTASPLLVVVTGPSGAGKDSVLARMRSLGRPYHFAVNATTRAPREGEVEGADYYFVSEDRFREMVENGELLEHAVVYGQHKGVPKGPILQALRSGKDVIVRADVQGARYIKSVAPGAVTIFVTAPSLPDLERRLTARAADSPEQIELRLRTARSEVAAAGEFDYVVVNDDLDRCVAEVEAILARERERSGRPPIDL